MDTESNKELVRAVFERMSRGDTRALSEAMADDCRWVFPGNWSWSGTWESKPVVVRGLLRPLAAQFTEEGYRSSANLLLAEGDRVVAQVEGHATTTRGETYRQTYCFIFRIVGGRIAEVIEYCDTALVERVLEPLRPPS